MRKPTLPLTPLQLRKLLRCFSAQPTFLHPPPPLLRPFSASNSAVSSPHIFSQQRSSFRIFSSLTNDSGSFNNAEKNEEEVKNVAEDLSAELLKTPDEEPLPLPQRLDLSFSHIAITPALILATLNISPDAGRAALDFFKWAKSKPDFHPGDEVYSYFIDYFGRRKDFKAANEVLVDGCGEAGIKCLEALVDRLVRAGRPTHVVALFDRMEEYYRFSRNVDSLKLIVTSL